MSDIVIPTSALGGDVDKTSAEEMATRYRGALSQTRKDIGAASGQREDIQSRNLAAIDESIQSLKNSRYTGAIGLNPTVSAAMAAGFLRTTPGVASNYANELGNAMAGAAPVVGALEKSDRDSFALLAELQRKRGEFEAEPIKDTLAELRAREKEEMANLRSAEAAGLRGTTQGQRDQTKIDAKTEADRLKREQDTLKQLERMHANARADMQAVLKGKEDIPVPDQDLLRRWHLEQHINTWNNQPGAIKINNPEPLTDDERKRLDVVKAGINERGIQEKNAAQLAKIRTEAQNEAPKRTGMEVFQTLAPEHQQALIDKMVADRVAEHDSRIDDPLKKIGVPPIDNDAVAAARAAAQRVSNLGSPDDATLKREHLPLANKPNAYDGMSYPQRKSEHARAAAVFDKEISTERAQANDLAKRNEQANDAWVNYNNTDRRGAIMGKTTAQGSAPAQAFDKVVADMQLYNFPKGQGQISEGERNIMKNAGPLRELEPEALRTVLDTYRATTVRANEQVAFKEAWFRAHGTIQGATEAWNRYIDSPQGSVMVLRDKQTGKVTTDIADVPIDMDRMEIVRNPSRMDWKTYFDKENDGSLNKKRKKIVDGKLVEY